MPSASSIPSRSSAQTLYEAVAQALRAFREHDWCDKDLRDSAVIGQPYSLSYASGGRNSTMNISPGLGQHCLSALLRPQSPKLRAAQGWYHTALVSAFVPSSDADLPGGQRAVQCQDPADLPARDQEKPRRLPASVIGVGRKHLSERDSAGFDLTSVPHFCESFGTFVGI